MVDGISFLSGASAVATSRGIDNTKDTAPLERITNVPVSGPAGSVAADDKANPSSRTTTDASRSALLSADNSSVLLQDQEQQQTADQTGSNSRTQREVQASIQTFDDRQQVANNTPPQQQDQPQYFNAGVKINV
ncbi:MAG: hypothetical protein PW788_12685 [Micavibrio sp.]|nr:hypothetical protein [Micavibrio sp.]